MQADESNRSTIGLLIVSCAIIVFTYLLPKYAPVWNSRAMIDGFWFQSAQFALLILATVLTVMYLRSCRKLSIRKHYCHFALGLGAFFVAMEEISWGNNYLPYNRIIEKLFPSAHAFIQTNNLQADTTLHNFFMGPTSGNMGTISMVVFLGALIYGILMPISKAISKRVDGYYQQLGIIVPAVWSIPLFLGVTLIVSNTVLGMNSEHMEFIVGVICCAIIMEQILSNWPSTVMKNPSSVLAFIRKRSTMAFILIVCLGVSAGIVMDVGWLSVRKLAGKSDFPFGLHYLYCAKCEKNERNVKVLLEAIGQCEGEHVKLLLWQSEILDHSGDTQQAQALRTRAEDIAQGMVAETADSSYANYMAGLAFAKSDSRRSAAYFNRAKVLCQAKIDVAAEQWTPYLVDAMFAYEEGRSEDALSTLQQAITIAQVENSQFNEFLFKSNLAFPNIFVEDAILMQRINSSG